MLTSRKPKNIKYHNQRLILALLRRYLPSSRQEGW